MATGQWRVNAVDPDRSHHITSHRNFGYGHNGTCPPDSDTFAAHEFPDTDFDELVVGKWCHIESMDDNEWWMSIGGVTLHVTTDHDGRPTRVRVDGPGGDWDDAIAGCTYECTWSKES